METLSRLIVTFLLNGAWQVCLLAGAAGAAALLLRGAAARHRHRLWVTALVVGLVLPLLTLRRESGPTVRVGVKQPAPIVELVPSPRSASQPLTAARVLPPVASPEPSALRLSPPVALTLAALYGVLVVWNALRLLRAWMRTRALARNAHEVALPPAVQAVREQCEQRLGLDGVPVLVSTDVPLPVTIGIVRPVVILPEELLRETNPDVLMSALGHELAHVARRDCLLNFLYLVLSLPLAFHPAVAWIKARINHTRELRCDELVTERLLDAAAYARSLVELAGGALPLVRPQTLVALGINDGDGNLLEERVMTMLRNRKLSLSRTSVLLVAALAQLIVPSVVAAPYAVRVAIDPTSASQAPIPNLLHAALQEGGVAGGVPGGVPGGVAGGVQAQEQVVREKKARAESAPVDRESKEYRAGVQAGEGWARERQAESGQEPTEAQGRERREKRAMEERQTREEYEKAVKEGRGAEYEAKVRAGRQEKERQAQAERAARQAEFARAARIAIPEAIQIATRQVPGTATGVRLVGEPGQQPRYLIDILTTNGTQNASRAVMVNAVDGRVEELKEREPGPEARTGYVMLNNGERMAVSFSARRPEVGQVWQNEETRQNFRVAQIVEENGAKVAVLTRDDGSTLRVKLEEGRLAGFALQAAKEQK